MVRRAPISEFLNEEWQLKMKKIDDCILCHHCSDHCPYFLDTPNLLKRNWEDYKTFID
jgi:succinate dehydrogenase/fumarate reductase-like Fe-S protein